MKKINPAFLHFSKTHKILQSKDGGNYVMPEIQLNEKLILSSDDGKNEYTVTNAHNTVFEYDDPKKSRLNQYHCTIEFKGPDGDYRAHIYFNDKDKVIATDFHKKERVAGKYSISAQTELDNNPGFAKTLEELAIAQSAPMVSELRPVLDREFHDLEVAYISLETELEQLSLNLLANYEQYQACLAKMKELLGSLSVYHQDYRDLFKLYYTYNFTGMLRVAEPAVVLEKPIEAAVAPEDLIEVDQKAEPRISLLLTQEYIETKAALDNFCAAKRNKNLSRQEKLSIFFLFDSKISALLSFVSNPDYQITSEEGSHLHCLYLMHTVDGKKLLADTLLNNPDPSSAQPLVKFCREGSYERLLFTALKLKRADILGFLLTQPGSSLTLALVKKYLDSCGDANKIDVPCLAVLLKHQPELIFLEINSKPLAYYLAMDRRMSALLNDNYEQIGANPVRFNRFIDILVTFRASAVLAVQEMRELDSYLAICKSALHEVRQHAGSKTWASMGKKFIQSISKVKQSPAVEQLLNDPALKQKKHKLSTLSTQVNLHKQSLLGSTYNNAKKHIVRDRLKQLSEARVRVKKSADVLDSVNAAMTHAELKEGSNWYLDKAMELEQLRIEWAQEKMRFDALSPAQRQDNLLR